MQTWLPAMIRRKKEDFGAVGGPRAEFLVPFPVSWKLRAVGDGSGAWREGP